MARKTKAPRALLIAEREVPLTLKKMRGARRITLQWRPLERDALLTMPAWVSTHEALAFAETRKAWLEKLICEHGEARPFVDGAVIPVFGTSRTVRYAPGLRGVVEEQENLLLVPGAPEFCPRRLRDWLIAQAKERIGRLAEAKAGRIGQKVRRIRLGDTGSRWGSCGTNGVLSFSWRLVFAPAEVLDYVVSHEVAHLAHMNHSAAFWRVVEALCPSHRQSRDWLLTHGHTLYAYG